MPADVRLAHKFASVRLQSALPLSVDVEDPCHSQRGVAWTRFPKTCPTPEAARLSADGPSHGSASAAKLVEQALEGVTFSHPALRCRSERREEDPRGCVVDEVETRVRVAPFKVRTSGSADPTKG